VVFRERLSDATHMALVRGEPRAEVETLVRVHEPLSAVDLLDTESTTHSWSVPAALAALAAAPCGVLVFLHRCETAKELCDRRLLAKPSGRRRWTCATTA